MEPHPDGDRDNEQEYKGIFEPPGEEKKGRQLKHVIGEKQERRLAREELRARIGKAQHRVQPCRDENDRQTERKWHGKREPIIQHQNRSGLPSDGKPSEPDRGSKPQAAYLRKLWVNHETHLEPA